MDTWRKVGWTGIATEIPMVPRKYCDNLSSGFVDHHIITCAASHALHLVKIFAVKFAGGTPW